MHVKTATVASTFGQQGQVVESETLQSIGTESAHLNQLMEILQQLTVGVRIYTIYISITIPL